MTCERLYKLVENVKNFLMISFQTLEVVEFVKSHPFINAKWSLCPGAKEHLLGEENFLQKGGQPKCEMVVQPMEEVMLIPQRIESEKN